MIRAVIASVGVDVDMDDPAAFWDRTRVHPTEVARVRAERHRARLTTAGFALDTADLRHLLTVLNLWPHQDPRLPESNPAYRRASW